jgi:hypothetical protein
VTKEQKRINLKLAEASASEMMVGVGGILGSLMRILGKADTLIFIVTALDAIEGMDTTIARNAVGDLAREAERAMRTPRKPRQ